MSDTAKPDPCFFCGESDAALVCDGTRRLECLGCGHTGQPGENSGNAYADAVLAWNEEMKRERAAFG